MFTNRDKIKELIHYFANNADCLIYENTNYKPVGVSVVLTYKYTFKDTEIVYNKWFVECADMAKKMGLPGTEHHNKLVTGSGVNVSSKRLGCYTFYGKDASDIIKDCEFNHDLASHVLLKNNYVHR